MWFLTVLIIGVSFWLLWGISRNTRDTLEKQTELQRELQQLSKLLSAQQIAGQTLKAEPIADLKDDNSRALNAKKLSPKVETKEKKKSSNTLVNINEADIKTLQTLPGIGKTVAQKIIEARPFTDIQNLINISGISEELLNKLKTLVAL